MTLRICAQPVRALMPTRHIDAALYALAPPKVTTLYAVSVPSGEPQVCRYDDGTGDELEVPLGGTACTSVAIPISIYTDSHVSVVSGKTMFDILTPAQKSLAVRTKVRYVSLVSSTHRKRADQALHHELGSSPVRLDVSSACPPHWSRH